MVEEPSASQDRAGAAAQVTRLLAPPLLFLFQFGGVYGWTGLACALGWDAFSWGPLQTVPLGVALITLVALGAMWWTWPARLPPDHSPRLQTYAPRERGHFMTSLARMVAQLCVAGMLAVAAMALVSRACAVSP